MSWNAQDRMLGGMKAREDINENLYPKVRTAYSIIQERRRASEARETEAARAKVAALQQERAQLRAEAAQTFAEREEAAFKEQMLARYVAAGGVPASFYQVFPAMWKAELANRATGQDSPSRHAIRARYAF